MKQIYDYTDYRTFLKDLFTAKKREASYYSLRNISSRIGMRSSGYLSMIINGQRNLSANNAEKLAEALKLSKKEQEYFKALIHFNQAKNQDQKERFYRDLKRSAINPASPVKKEQHRFYEKWYHSAVRELLAIREVTESNIKDMTAVIKPRITEKEFKSSLKMLVKTELAFIDDHGVYRRSNNLITTGKDFRSFTIHKFQKETVNLAIDALDNFPREERELSTLSMSINKKTYKKILEKSAAFRKEIMELAAETSDPDSIYQLNLQIFPLSKTEGGDNE